MKYPFAYTLRLLRLGFPAFFFFSLAPARILGGQTATIHEQ